MKRLFSAVLAISIIILFSCTKNDGIISPESKPDPDPQPRPNTLPDFVFISDENGSYDVFTQNIDGSQRTNLTKGPNEDFGPDLSPDREKILYTSTFNGQEDILIMNSDGSSLMNLTNSTRNEYYPEFNITGDKIYYVTEADSDYHIFRMNIDGSNKQKVTPFFAKQNYFHFSANGEYLVFQSNESGTWQVYRLNLITNEVIQVTHTNFNCFLPKISADGSLILYTNHEDSSRNIYSINANGSNTKCLTASIKYDCMLYNFTADGNRILFLGEKTNYITSFHESELWIMDVDGSNQTKLIDNGSMIWNPELLSDGSGFLMMNKQDGDYEIWMYTFASKALVQLTHNTVFDGYLDVK